MAPADLNARDPHAGTLAARALAQLLGERWASPWTPWGLAAGLAGALGCLGACTANTTCCPFRLLTGRPCPACGLTRAVLALGAGHPADAWRLHPFAFVVAAVVAALAADQLWWLARGRALLTPPRVARLAPLGWALAPAWLAFAVSRWI